MSLLPPLTSTLLYADTLTNSPMSHTAADTMLFTSTPTERESLCPITPCPLATRGLDSGVEYQKKGILEQEEGIRKRRSSSIFASWSNFSFKPTIYNLAETSLESSRFWINEERKSSEKDIKMSPPTGSPLSQSLPPPSQVASNQTPNSASSSSATASSSHAGPSRQFGFVSWGDRHPPGRRESTLGAMRSFASNRRQSRFDPMARDDEEMEDEYGDLGNRHPLRRVQEEGKETSITLPSIKSLFSAAGDHPPSSGLPFGGSLQSVTPGSPSSSPSTAARTSSRYSSMGSSFSTVSEQQTQFGWWSDMDSVHRSSTSSIASAPASSFFPGYKFSGSRQYSQPEVVNLDDHDSKRRRSDQPLSAHENDEEAARLRWQAQSRNASFPSTIGSISAPSGQSLLMSRGSVSHGTFEDLRRSSIVPPPHRSGVRNTSIVGGQLVQSFADLRADESASSSASSSRNHSPHRQGRPILPNPTPDRRSSIFPISTWNDDNFKNLPFPSPSARRPTITPASLLLHSSFTKDQNVSPGGPGPLSAVSQPSSRASTPVASSKKISLTRPPTPEPRPSQGMRRSSLTEFIMAKSGDKQPDQPSSSSSGSGSSSGKYTVTNTSRPNTGEQKRQDVFRVEGSGGGIEMDKPSLSDTALILGPPLNTFRNFSGDVATSSDSPRSRVAEQEEYDGNFTLRGRKRPDSANIIQSSYRGVESDSGIGGMDILAEGAVRLSGNKHPRQSPYPPQGGQIKEERTEFEHFGQERDDPSPSRGAGPSSGAGPKYACAYCAKTFSRPSSLRIHTYSHTGERPFVCKEPSCRRRFSVQSNLKRHAKVHQINQAHAALYHPQTPSSQPPQQYQQGAYRQPNPNQGEGLPYLGHPDQYAPRQDLSFRGPGQGGGGGAGTGAYGLPIMSENRRREEDDWADEEELEDDELDEEDYGRED